MFVIGRVLCDRSPFQLSVYKKSISSSEIRSVGRSYELRRRTQAGERAEERSWLEYGCVFN